MNPYIQSVVLSYMTYKIIRVAISVSLGEVTTTLFSQRNKLADADRKHSAKKTSVSKTSERLLVVVSGSHVANYTETNWF